MSPHIYPATAAEFVSTIGMCLQGKKNTENSFHKSHGHIGVQVCAQRSSREHSNGEEVKRETSDSDSFTPLNYSEAGKTLAL